MDSANWLTAIGQAARLFVESIPDSFWLAYNLAKEWQFLLAGLFVLVAAQIFARASVRTARIRAAATVRAAQIAAGIALAPEARPVSSRASDSPLLRPSPQARMDLAHKLEQLRRLIRSAMVLLASNVDGANLAGNIYYERISKLRFDESDLPDAATSDMLERYRQFLSQLATIRHASEKGQSQRELSEALFQLNTRARELTAAVAPSVTNVGAERVRLPAQVRA